jgi:hypothetical protein
VPKKFVPLFWSIAVKGFSCAELIDRSVHGPPGGGWQRLGDVANAAANQPSGCLWICVGERFDAAAYLGKKISRLELKVVRVEMCHEDLLGAGQSGRERIRTTVVEALVPRACERQAVGTTVSTSIGRASRLAQSRFVVLLRSPPGDDIPPSLEIVGAPVLIFQVVCVFPYIDPNDGDSHGAGD